MVRKFWIIFKLIYKKFNSTRYQQKKVYGNFLLSQKKNFACKLKKDNKMIFQEIKKGWGEEEIAKG